jgi:hypothetical protein
MGRGWWRTLPGLLALAAAAAAAPVKVRHREGLVHGFLLLRSPGGEPLAEGEFLQKADRKQATTRVRFRFHDGSIHDESATFTQEGVFSLVGYRLHQEGPSFPTTLDAEIGAPRSARGRRRVRVSYRKPDGERRDRHEEMELPADLANGLAIPVIKNLAPAGAAQLHLLAFRPDPKLVRFELEPVGSDRVIAAGQEEEAVRYRGHVDLGAVVGTLAKIVGKDPPDVFLWVLGGDHPAYLRSEAPLFVEGPIWRVELANPRWPSEADGRSSPQR